MAYIALEVYIGLRVDKTKEHFSYATADAIIKNTPSYGELAISFVDASGNEVGKDAERARKLEVHMNGELKELERQCNCLNQIFETVFEQLQQNWILLAFRSTSSGSLALGSIELKASGKRKIDLGDFQISVSTFDRLGTSPYRLPALLGVCRERLFVGGQVLRYITEPTLVTVDYKALFFEFLRRSPHNWIHVLISNPETHSEIDAWASVTGPQYPRHLERSRKVLLEWYQEAQELGLTGFVVKRTRLFPVTLTLVDAHDDEHGILVLVPVLDADASTRPGFVAYRKTQPNIVDYYAGVVDLIFDSATPIDA